MYFTISMRKICSIFVSLGECKFDRICSLSLSLCQLLSLFGCSESVRGYICVFEYLSFKVKEKLTECISNYRLHSVVVVGTWILLYDKSCSYCDFGFDFRNV